MNRDPLLVVLKPRSLTYEQRRELNSRRPPETMSAPRQSPPRINRSHSKNNSPRQRSGPKYLDFVESNPPKLAPANKTPWATVNRQPQKTISPASRPLFTAEHKPAKKPRFVFYRWIVPAMAVLLFIAGTAITIQTFRTNKEVQAQVAGAAVVNTEENPNEEDTATPSEVEPTPVQIAAYKVDPSAPRYVRVADVKIYARIYGLGIDNEGKFRAPNNIYNVGWYDKSARPGESGAVLLDGHSAGIKGNAIFSRLKNVKAGTRIEIERGDGQKIGYRVISTESVHKDQLDMSKSVISAEPGKNGLNIITCDGEYDTKTKTYDNRLLVRAVQE